MIQTMVLLILLEVSHTLQATTLYIIEHRHEVLGVMALHTIAMLNLRGLDWLIEKFREWFKK